MSTQMPTQSKNIAEAVRRWLRRSGQGNALPNDQSLKGEELFARFMRHLPGLAWLKDLQGQFVFANEAAMKAFAPGLIDIAGKTNADLLPSDVALQCDASDSQAAQSEAGIEVLETYTHADGTQRIMLVNKFPIAGADGKPALIGGIAIDITERKRAEQDLRLSEERLRLATEAGKVGVWEWDIVRNAVTWSSTVYAMHGLSPGEFDGTVESFAALTHPEDRPMVMQAIDAALESQQHYEIEFRAIRPDGKIIWVYTHANVVREKGVPVRLTGATLDITSRKQTELALRESEERFAKAFNASPLSLTLSSLKTGKLLEVNETFSAVSGYTREDAIGRTTVELGLWTNTQERDAELDAVRTAGKVRKLEYRFRTKAGKEVLGLLSAEKIDIGGEPYALTVIEDISDREVAQKALLESEERLRLALRSASAGAWTLNIESGTTFWSEEFEPLYGYDHTTPRRIETWLASVHEEDRARVQAEIKRRVASSQIDFRQEFRIVHPVRGVRWILDLGHIEREATGRALSFSGISLDITDRKQMEEALRTSETLYRAIGESIDYGVWICDPTGKNTYASESFLRLVGLTQEQCSSFGWGEVLHPDDSERTIAAWQECVRTGGQWDIQHRCRGVDGKWHPILARGVPVKNDAGEITAWAGINLDISHLKHVEDELREADQRKNEFLATLAHELRNPLAPIRNGLEILRLTKGVGEAGAQARDMMDRQLRQMVRLIDDLLDLSRISRGKIDLQLEPVDLAKAIHVALEISQPLITEAGHKLTVEIPKESLHVQADQTRLSQVFANVINNAAKYTDKGGHIWLTIKRQGEQVNVSVRDNGMGIPAHLLPRVFEMFTQGNRSLEKTPSGLGVGLSIAKRLVEMHGGAIEARSDGHGCGSEFVVHLPLMAAHAANHAPAMLGSTHNSEMPGLRVLIADDNADAASSLALILQLSGHDVRTAYDGVEAVKIADVFAPQVALLDIGMPQLNGYDACRRIRQQAGNAATLIIAMTGWGQEADKLRSQQAGFDHHLVKPVEASTVEDLLERQRKKLAAQMQ